MIFKYLNNDFKDDALHVNKKKIDYQKIMSSYKISRPITF
jgi:hypothetical protein